MIKTFLNPEGHHNRISGSKVTAILLKGRILPIVWASSVGGSAMNRATPSSFQTNKAIVWLGWTNQNKNIMNICQLVWTSFVQIKKIPKYVKLLFKTKSITFLQFWTNYPSEWTTCLIVLCFVQSTWQFVPSAGQFVQMQDYRSNMDF